MEAIRATYHLDVPAGEARALAESVLLEQTIETPASVGRRYDFVREHMMGTVDELAEDARGGFRAVLTLPVVTATVDPAQFLNVLFGNSSLHEHVVLEDVEIPASVRAMFAGPRFGIAGLRARVGVQDRPLTCSALKPVGLRLDEMVELCRRFAEGGIDIIKDDHYLADHPFCRFEDRLHACAEAVREVEARTGHRALYVPNVSGTPDAVRRQIDVAQRAGVDALMVAPMLLGMPFFHELTSRHLEVPVLAHPSFGGIQRIRPATLFGKLFRLFGADAVIFANYGGRFSYAKDVCASLADALRAPWHDLRPSFPVPAGGMQVERTAELVDFFGRDAVLLIGGSLLEAGDRLVERTRTFTDAVARAALSLQDHP